MCKVLMSIGVKKSKRAANSKFMMASLAHMSSYDKDGLGYVAADGTKIWGERWLVNKNAFKVRTSRSGAAQKVHDIFGSALSSNEKEYNQFGSGGFMSATSILLHTRKATCARNITNTHPFVIEDTALIHNGVIKNDTKLMAGRKAISTCDSESILQEYLYNGVNIDPTLVKNLGEVLDGWYVAGLISKDKDGRQIVDVFKCDESKLQVAFIKELDNFVLCTTMEILEKTAKDAKMNIEHADSLKGGMMFRFDAKTGEKILEQEFLPECLDKHKSGFYATSEPSSYTSGKPIYNAYHPRGY